MLPAVLFYDKDDVEITRGRNSRSKTTIEELSEDDETSPRRGA